MGNGLSKLQAHHISAAREVAKLLSELLEVPEADVAVELKGGRSEPDFLLNVGGRKFLADYKASGAAAPVLTSILQLREYIDASRGGLLPLIVVPHMGDVGKRYCQDHGVSWLDLSGNAEIRAPGLKIKVEGKPNRFKSARKPSNLFAPVSSRVARFLLINYGKSFSQRTLAHDTGLDEGSTSRIVRKLEEENFVRRDETGAVAASDPNLLLDAWTERYSFSDHQIIQGHIPLRSSEEVIRKVAAVLSGGSVRFAATGLAAGWLLSRFAGFRLSTFYVDSPLSSDLEHAIGFRPEARGANTWFVVPQDPGVFYGSSLQEGVMCVHPVQAYLDLKGHPERANEAAEELRSRFLNWRTRGK